jgi:hypothetical protein
MNARLVKLIRATLAVAAIGAIPCIADAAPLAGAHAPTAAVAVSR